MHYLLWMSSLFVLSSTCLQRIYAADVKVSVQDPRIVYVGEWTDQDNGGHKFANNAPGASASLTFKGTAVQFLGARNPNGGKILVSVDGEQTTIDASANTTRDDVATPATLFTKTSLDNSKEHTIRIEYGGPGSLGGPYLEVYGFIYTDPNASASSTPPASTTVGGMVASSSMDVSVRTTVSGERTVTVTENGTPASVAASASTTSEGHGGSSGKGALIGGVVGGVIGGVVGAALLSLLALCILRRRRARKQREAKDAEETARPFPSDTGSPVVEKDARNLSAGSPHPANDSATLPVLPRDNSRDTTAALHDILSIPRGNHSGGGSTPPSPATTSSADQTTAIGALSLLHIPPNGSSADDRAHSPLSSPSIIATVSPTLEEADSGPREEVRSTPTRSSKAAVREAARAQVEANRNTVAAQPSINTPPRDAEPEQPTAAHRRALPPAPISGVGELIQPTAVLLPSHIIIGTGTTDSYDMPPPMYTERPS